MTIAKLALIAVATLTVVGTPSAAHADDNCIVYENKHFQGVTLTLKMNQSVPALGEHRQQNFVGSCSSGLHTRWICKSKLQRSQTWGPGDYPTLPKGWDDAISSVQCSCSE
jgi:hypothetical protein